MISELQLNPQDSELFKSYKQKNTPAHSKAISCLNWNPTGAKLASADSSLRIWNYDDSTGLTRSREYKNESTIESLEWGDQCTVLTVSKDSFKIWDIRDSKPARVDKNSEKKTRIDFTRGTWNPDGNQFALSNKENVISFFDKRATPPVESIKVGFDVEEFAWDHTDSVFLVVGETGHLMVYESSKGHTFIDSVVCSSVKIKTMAVSPCNRYVCTGGQDANCLLLTLQQFLPLRCYNRTDGIISKVSFSHNSRYLAASSDEQYVDIYNVENGVHSFRIETLNPANYVRWHPKKLILAMCDEDEKKKQGTPEDSMIRLWVP